MKQKSLSAFTVALDWHRLEIPLSELASFLETKGNMFSGALRSVESLRVGTRVVTASGLEFLLVKSTQGDTASLKEGKVVYVLQDFQVAACSYFIVYAEYVATKKAGTTLNYMGERSSVPRRSGPRVPQLAIWTVTKRCNLSCRHCYFFGEGIAHGPDLSVNKAEGILDQLLECGFAAVSFSGGEPLLHPHIWRLVRRAKTGGLKTVLDTSAVKLADHPPDALLQTGLDVVIGSLDGSDHAHNASRGSGAYKRTLAGLRNASEAGIFTAVNVVLKADNSRDEPEQIVNEAIKLGLNLVKFETVLPAGRAAERDTAVVLEYMELVSLGRELDRIRRKYYHAVPIVLPIPVLGILFEYPFFCPSGNDFVSISNDGFVAPCPSLTHVYRQDDRCSLAFRGLKAVLDDIEFRKESELSSSCKACAFGDTCRSGCLTRSYYKTARVLSRDPLCIQRQKALQSKLDGGGGESSS